jgi:hypothetical protein
MVIEFKDMDGQTDMTIHIGLGSEPPSPAKSKNLRIIEGNPLPLKSIVY